MIVQMSEDKAKVLSCLTAPPEIPRLDVQKPLTMRHRPTEDEVCETFVASLKLVFARLPLAMEIQACAMGALHTFKLGFRHRAHPNLFLPC